MSLAALIRKRTPSDVATATPATPATQRGESGEAVAKVAEGAVANPPADCTVPAYRWRIHYADKNPMEVTCTPLLTHDEILVAYPAALSAEPLAEVAKPQATTAQERELRRLYDALAALHHYPMPETWLDDSKMILRDPDQSLQMLRSLCANQCPEILNHN